MVEPSSTPRSYGRGEVSRKRRVQHPRPATLLRTCYTVGALLTSNDEGKESDDVAARRFAKIVPNGAKTGTLAPLSAPLAPYLAIRRGDFSVDICGSRHFFRWGLGVCFMAIICHSLQQNWGVPKAGYFLSNLDFPKITAKREIMTSRKKKKPTKRKSKKWWKGVEIT